MTPATVTAPPPVTEKILKHHILGNLDQAEKRLEMVKNGEGKLLLLYPGKMALSLVYNAVMQAKADNGDPENGILSDREKLLNDIIIVQRDRYMEGKGGLDRIAGTDGDVLEDLYSCFFKNRDVKTAKRYKLEEALTDDVMVTIMGAGSNNIHADFQDFEIACDNLPGGVGPAVFSVLKGASPIEGSDEIFPSGQYPSLGSLVGFTPDRDTCNPRRTIKMNVCSADPLNALFSTKFLHQKLGKNITLKASHYPEASQQAGTEKNVLGLLIGICAIIHRNNPGTLQDIITTMVAQIKDKQAVVAAKSAAAPHIDYVKSLPGGLSLVRQIYPTDNFTVMVNGQARDYGISQDKAIATDIRACLTEFQTRNPIGGLLLGHYIDINKQLITSEKEAEDFLKAAHQVGKKYQELISEGWAFNTSDTFNSMARQCFEENSATAKLCHQISTRINNDKELPEAEDRYTAKDAADFLNLAAERLLTKSDLESLKSLKFINNIIKKYSFHDNDVVGLRMVQTMVEGNDDERTALYDVISDSTSLDKFLDPTLRPHGNTGSESPEHTNISERSGAATVIKQEFENRDALELYGLVRETGISQEREEVYMPG